MLDVKQIESFYPKYLRQFKRSILREYLQYKILESIFDSKFGNSLVFMGGTATHIIHGNTRFSEDLDFDNLKLERKGFIELSGLIKKRLEREGYIVDIKNVFKNAYTAYLKLPGLLYENNLSRHKEERLLIKIDTEPQNFKYNPEKTIINKFDVFIRIKTVPADLLLSQKICAIFKRKRPMGRDFYDVVFLSGKTKPDLNYLKEKLKIKDNVDLKNRLLEKCKELNFKQLSQDIEQFLFVAADSKKVFLFREYINAIEF
ncbi:MAG: nucleotidyl transferase AbiEii/AbiGii toxin family protein [Candidatus Omnitrophica bacterium]|nr:nucleotidyl transferase AbiEii/AbiGii toxin family protein [Candidatus Omnitrophota bacterium]